MPRAEPQSEPLPLFKDTLRHSLATMKIDISEHQLNLMESHYVAMLAVNRTMNLTRITEPVEAAVKHYADSLALCAWLGSSAGEDMTLLDVGTGAGFPSVPLAVLAPTWSVHAIDATKKKISFVQDVCRDLGIENLSAHHARCEQWRPGLKFDLTVARAVASADKCLRWVRHHLAPGGRLACYMTEDQLARSQRDIDRAASASGMRILPPYAYKLSICDQDYSRLLLVFEEEAGT